MLAITDWRYFEDFQGNESQQGQFRALSTGALLSVHAFVLLQMGHATVLYTIEYNAVLQMQALFYKIQSFRYYYLAKPDKNKQDLASPLAQYCTKIQDIGRRFCQLSTEGV